MVDVKTAAHFLGADTDDIEEAQLIQGMILSAYARLYLSTGQDWAEYTGSLSPIVDDTVLTLCYLSYYNNRDDTRNFEHLQNYINSNIFLLQMYTGDDDNNGG